MVLQHVLTGLGVQLVAPEVVRLEHCSGRQLRDCLGQGPLACARGVAQSARGEEAGKGDLRWWGGMNWQCSVTMSGQGGEEMGSCGWSGLQGPPLHPYLRDWIIASFTLGKAHGLFAPESKLRKTRIG